MSIKYRRLDSDGDYTLGRGLQDYLTGIDAVAQAILTRLKLFLAEWWEDTTEGIPMFTKMLGTSGSATNISAVDLLIKTRITGTTGVTGITSYTSSFDSTTRAYTFTAYVETEYGSLEVSSEEAS